jgi:predicted ATPase
MLELAFGTCVEDSSARALLVTAPAGVGKSRLCQEFLRRLESQGREVLLLLGRGDPMHAEPTHGLLGQALRRLCGILEREEPAASREKLRQRVGQHLPPAQARATAELLGELCGLPFPDEDSPALRAARAEPKQLSAQVERAFVSFLEAECARAPVLLVLEELHWADARTVQLVDEALRALAERPLLVLALARPEVKELFPGLWGQHVQEFALRGLSRKASARLAREVLGPEVPEPIVERVVEQAAGNALFLEGLLRAVAEGQGESPPAAVLAMLQARLLRLEPEARQVLLAASLFGRTFWAGGVRALLGSGEPEEALQQRLQQLVELELVERQPESRFPAEPEYRFRHALMREAAYGLLPPGGRPSGHQRARAWLEQKGSSDSEDSSSL